MTTEDDREAGGFSVSTRRDGSRGVVALVGELDLHTAGELTTAVSGLLQQKVTRVEVDAGGLSRLRGRAPPSSWRVPRPGRRRHVRRDRRLGQRGAPDRDHRAVRPAGGPRRRLAPRTARPRGGLPPGRRKPSSRSHPSQAEEAGVSVRDVDPAGPGLRRRRFGRGFGYIDERGRRIADAAVIDRIKALAIPRRGRTCGSARTRRATSRPADWMRGRRQYRYHDEWRAQQDRDKHDRMLELARALPRLRRRLRRDLTTDGLGRDRVLACAVRLLELGLFRVGGEPYVEENGSYGLQPRCASDTCEPSAASCASTTRARAISAASSRSGTLRLPTSSGHSSAAAVGPGTAGLQGRPWALGGRAVVGHQRVHAAGAGTGVLGQGLPDMDGHRPGCGGACGRGRRGDRATAAEGGRPSRPAWRSCSATHRPWPVAPMSTPG